MYTTWDDAKNKKEKGKIIWKKEEEEDWQARRETNMNEKQMNS